jgi:hypothetical protein
MNDRSIEDLFSDKNYCLQEILRMRKAWGNIKTFTPETIEASRRVLGFMILYAPEEIKKVALSHIEELGKREILCLSHGIGNRKRAAP